MATIAQVMRLFNQQAVPLLDDLEQFLQPFAAVLPDRRFRYGLSQFVPGMLAARSPQVSQAAAHAPQRGADSWPLAKRIYRLLDTPDFQSRTWLKVIYADARRVIQDAHAERVIIALDPVNFEQPYAQKQEHLSEVWKSTPPGSLPERKSRITHGYPAVIAQTVNLAEPALPYAHWFSYTSPEFLSENREMERAVRTMRVFLPSQALCLVTDSGFDDQKFWAMCGRHNMEFITRASHDRWVDVFNDRLGRWESEHLQDLIATMPGQLGFEVSLTHAGKTISIHVTLDWLALRIPETQQRLWLVVGQSDYFQDPLVLVTNRPVHDILTAQQIYRDWLRRPAIEHFYRFLQEDGLDVEEIQVQTMERQRRTFTLVLASALFVLRRPGVWSAATIAWLRALGSSLTGTRMDRHGPYALLLGLHRVFSMLSLLSALMNGLLQPPEPPGKRDNAIQSYG